MPDRRLPRAVLAAAACAQMSVAVAGVLPWLLVPLSWGLLVLGGRAALGAAPPTAERLRLGATLGVTLLAVTLLPVAVTAGGSLPARAVLGPLLVAAQVLQALTWRGRRELQVGLTCSGGLLVLGASYAPDVLVGAPLLGGWVACLVAGLLAHRIRDAEGVDAVALAVRPGSTGDRSLVTVPALAMALGLVAFLLIPAPAAGGLRRTLSATFGADGGLPTRAALGATAYSGQVDLRVRGDLSPRPMAEVPAGSPALWRGQVYDRYDGSTWSVAPPALTVPGPPFDLGPLTAADPSDDAVLLETGEGTIFAPGDPRRVLSAPQVITHLLRDDLGNVRGVLRPDALGRAAYTVASQPVPTVSAELPSRAGTADATDPRWRGLPAALPGRVGDLARRLVAGTSSRAQAVLAVQHYLGQHATYRTDSPVPGPGEDAVDRFLFVDKTGFCEQFAAAETVLLRSVGIPARFVTGLAYGSPHGPGRRLYREADQHAWVEVWLPGVGWASSDPTAGAQLATGGAGQSLRQRMAATVSAALRSLQRVPGGRTGLALALLAATGLVAVWVNVRSRRRLTLPAARTGRRASGDFGRPALAAFFRLDSRLGRRRRADAESLAEMRDRLGLSGEAAAAFVVVERECYAAALPPDGPMAAAVLDRLAAPAE